jgi:hypothetical protein
MVAELMGQRHESGRPAKPDRAERSEGSTHASLDLIDPFATVERNQ